MRGEIGAVWAVFLKSFKVFSRYKVNFFPMVLGPLFVIFFNIYTALSFEGPQGVQGFYEYMGITDFVTFIILNNLLWRFITSMRGAISYSPRTEQWSGTLERIFVSPMRRVSLFVGYGLFGLILGLVEAAGIIVITPFLCGFSLSYNPLNVMLSLVVVTFSLLAMMGIGMAVAGVVLVYKEQGLIALLFSTPIIVLCGKNYTVNVLPPPLRLFSFIFPFTYSFDAIRGLLLGAETLMPLSVEIGVLSISSLLMLLLGFLIYRRFERVAKEKGVLGTY